MHNYGGEFIINRRFKSLINVDNFLNIKKSLTTLLDGKDEYESWNLKSNAPRRQLRKGMYFGEDHMHPNELGHKRITELIKEKICWFSTNRKLSGILK
jgi:lysophospholipase L1-like esterase